MDPPDETKVVPPSSTGPPSSSSSSRSFNIGGSSSGLFFGPTNIASSNVTFNSNSSNPSQSGSIPVPSVPTVTKEIFNVLVPPAYVDKANVSLDVSNSNIGNDASVSVSSKNGPDNNVSDVVMADFPDDRSERSYTGSDISNFSVRSRNTGDLIKSIVDQANTGNSIKKDNPKDVIIPIDDHYYVEKVFVDDTSPMNKSPGLAKKLLRMYLVDKLNIPDMFVDRRIIKSGYNQSDPRYKQGLLINSLLFTSKVFIAGNPNKRNVFTLIVKCKNSDSGQKLLSALHSQNVKAHYDRVQAFVFKVGPFSRSWREDNDCTMMKTRFKLIFRIEDL